MRRERRRSLERFDWDQRATEALEFARLLPPGRLRNDALKAASLLRCRADNFGITFAKRGRPRK
jgi:hypothetical protein